MDGDLSYFEKLVLVLIWLYITCNLCWAEVNGFVELDAESSPMTSVGQSTGTINGACLLLLAAVFTSGNIWANKPLCGRWNKHKIIQYK